MIINRNVLMCGCDGAVGVQALNVQCGIVEEL